jgi:hypothetical protein
MAEKKSKAKSPEQSGPERTGAPLLVALRAQNTAGEWLDRVQRAAELYPSFERIDPEAAMVAKVASQRARLAKAAIERGDAEGAAWAAMGAMDAAWLVDAIQGAMPKVKAGIKVAKQRSNAGFSSGQERAAERKPEWDEWQAAADLVRSENPHLSASRVCEIVAANFGRTRQAVARRVVIVATERPRFKK